MDNRQSPEHSLLTKKNILFHIGRKNIVIHPFNPICLGTTSYDVRLGENYFHEQQFRSSSRKIFNPFDPSDIKRYWGSPQQAIYALDWTKDNGPLNNIKPDDRIIILGPGEMILAHTQEFIGGRNCVTAEMRARSSLGRIGISVCKCAGWGDLGYVNRWTMEISNHLKDNLVVLVVGMRVAQMVFWEVDPLRESYVKTGGQYQFSDDLKKLIKDWSPFAMLPKFSRENY